MAACQWGDQVVSLVQPNQDDFAAFYTDTVTVKVSTVATDSLMTGAASRLLVGKYTDPYLGIMQGWPFFQPTLQSLLTLPEKAVYDSLELSLVYDGYYYGDTLKPMNLTVHALQEDMLLKSAYYNDDFTPYDPKPIGSKRIFPQPHPNARTPKRTLKIKLAGDLGQMIFDKAKANLLTSNAEWINIIKGIVVIPEATDNGAVVGFKTDSTFIKLHYHTPEVEGVTKDSTLFKVTASYNQVLGDRSKTILAKLPTTKRISLPSAQTGELTFVQNGSGIMTRLDLPTVRQFKYSKYTFANKAYLKIYPLRQSVTDQFHAPSRLYVFLCDRNNEYLQGSTGYPAPLTDLGGNTVTAPLINDLVNNRQYYSVDVSQYVVNIMRSESEEAAGLLLRASDFDVQQRDPRFPDLDTEITKSFNRVILGSQQNPDRGVKLELYYSTIKAQ